MFLGLQRLVLSAAQLRAGLDASCFLIQKADGAVPDDVALLSLNRLVGPQCKADVPDQRLVLRRIKVMPFQAEKALCLPDSGLRQPDIAVLLFIILVLF